MLKEYLQETDPTSELSRQTIVPGFEITHFSIDHLVNREPISLHAQKNDLSFEILFCQEGSLIFGRTKDRPITIGKNEVLLLKDNLSLHTALVTSPTKGFLAVIQNPEKFYSDHATFHIAQIEYLLRMHHGYARLEDTSWSRSMFSVLEKLTTSEQLPYCAIKIFELLYLLCTKSSALTLKAEPEGTNNYMFKTIHSIQTYIKEHLDEKLTIDFLSRKFHISATALKNGFRQIYGQPIHSWILMQRMEKAAYLLYISPMTILQISQFVGYEGVSQFNIIFKRHFGVTPSQYRKMSNSGNFNPIP